MAIGSSQSLVLTQSELESKLWAAANVLRGPVDAGDYKAYVFPVLFFKWISDSHDYWHQRAVSDWGDDLTDEIENSDYQPFAVPHGHHWRDVHSTTTNVGVALNTALQNIELANPELAGVFGDVNWANKDRLPENVLIELLDAFHETPMDPDSVKGDMLGAAYEYLLREFAEASGRKAGEFFTPRHVVHLLVRILQPQPGESLVDPACGSAGMLVETVNEVRSQGGDPRTLQLNGQEYNLTTSAIAKMNLYLHGVEDFSIRRGDTFGNPRFVTDGKLDTFDIVLVNPPFSLKNWGAKGWANDPYGRAFCGTPPSDKGDFAWIQHMVTSMKPGTGRVGVVMPHGVLFRKEESAIRKCLVGERDLLEAVIGLPKNLFYSTNIPVCLLIFRDRKPAERRGKVMFIDATTRYVAGVNQNVLTDEDVETIFAAYTKGKDTDGTDQGLHLRLVDVDDIAGNGFDLNIGRYLRTEASVEVDVDAALASYREAREDLYAAELRLNKLLEAANFDVQ